MTGWFIVDGVQDGERRLEDQLLGLALVEANCKGATVLDLGSAEGLISRHLYRHGARTALCVEALPSRVEAGKKLCAEAPVEFWAGSVEKFCEMDDACYDIVLALAILNKLRRPEVVLEHIAGACSHWLAIRLPDPIMHDRRSDFPPFNVQELLASRFDMTSEARTYAGSWTAVFRRIGCTSTTG